MGIQKLTDVRSLQLQHESAVLQKKGNADFAQVMQTTLDNSGVHFSKHAVDRIHQRGVEVTDGLVQSLNQAVEKARVKGAKDVAIIGAQSAFIVNVPNNTVITTMTEQEMKENIFTNIDSAVIL